ncbi:choline ABC transporter substrate-binding protein [Ancylobacter defluvii]|uniref:Glycine/betaine ABC transporter substrate-binding protein n=1 Tax=Ancylobacter defluvii TaxID=1282440 RepID=A0A9W6NC30_9HYPH|nr:choline ABC transporter substrate-binding protein [Ancylobacter defluvii]MBS7586833.1 choline ABC transporter substrate-binding protein [Ancylobacter defluvii]GLK86139.1 glycine/betaine ABC transporter substrate-binding protein [Ancylobacter defluvii]
MNRFLRAVCALSVVISAGSALAADAPTCKTVRMSDPGWTDITSTNAIASVLLQGLGYTADVKTLSVPIGYEAMKTGNLDVFLGNWMPAQQKFIDALNEANAVEVLATNLTGAKFTLAVPNYVAEAGVKDFKDLAANADKFGNQIYGIEPGAPANANIQKMIDAGEFGLKDWKVVESGEQAMLAQVKRSASGKGWIVFLAWAPHPMNEAFAITYLSGGDAYFGPDYGGAEVRTLARAGWSSQCPNAASFFRNLKFDLATENAMMGKILDEGMDPKAAATVWIKAHPQALEPWLAGVTTFDGKPGLPAVKASLGL